jgi:hypothetical protein
MALLMGGEFGAVGTGDRLAEHRGQGSAEGQEVRGNSCGRFGGLASERHRAGESFVGHEHGLAVLSKQHEIGLPVTWVAAGSDVSRALGNGHAVLDKLSGTAALASPPAAFAFAPGQVMPPPIIFAPPDLALNETINRLMTDDRPAVLPRQATAPPAAAAGLLVGVGRRVSPSRAPLALQFASNRRWRALQSCCNLAERLSFLAQPGNTTPLFPRELFIMLSPGNTLYPRCCTSFVTLAHPGKLIRVLCLQFLDARLRGHDSWEFITIIVMSY